MSVEIDITKSISIFSELTDHQLSSCELLSEHRRLKAGAGLCWQGEPSDELAFVSSGELDAKTANHHVATIVHGKLFGELAVFTRDQRTPGVLAGSNGAEVLCLSRQNLETFQQVLPEFYDTISDVALDRSARRVHEMGRSIAKLAQGGNAAPKTKEENAFGKLWQRLTSGGNQNPPSALSAVRKSPWLKNAPMQHLQGIVSAMTPHHAACAASDNTSCWVYELHVDAYRKLKGSPGHFPRESLLSSLVFQVGNADEKLILLKVGSRPKQSDHDSIRGGLAGFQGGEL